MGAGFWDLLLAACAVLLMDLFNNDPERRPTFWLTQAAVAGYAWLHVQSYLAGTTAYGLKGMVVIDPMGDLLAVFDHIGHRHGLGAGVDAHEVAHAGVGAELAATRQALVARIAQAGQRGAQHRQGLARLVQRDVQLAQQHVQGRFAVQRQHDVVFRAGDAVARADGLTALGDARDHLHPFTKGHAAEPAGVSP